MAKKTTKKTTKRPSPPPEPVEDEEDDEEDDDEDDEDVPDENSPEDPAAEPPAAPSGATLIAADAIWAGRTDWRGLGVGFDSAAITRGERAVFYLLPSAPGLLHEDLQAVLEDRNGGPEIPAEKMADLQAGISQDLDDLCDLLRTHH